MSEPTLALNCLLLGSGSSEVFQVKILKTKAVSFLKELIKEKQSPRLNHVQASELTLWKVSLPVDTITPELTLDDVEGKELRSVKMISSVVSEGLVYEHVHILVQTPIGMLYKRFLGLSWPFPCSFVFTTSPRSKLNWPVTALLNGFVLPVNGYPSQNFMVEVLTTENVSRLKDLVKEKLSDFLKHVGAWSFTLSQVSLPMDDDLEESLQNVDLTPLNPRLKLSQVFPRVKSNYLHIVVQASTYVIPQKRLLPESDDMHSRLKRSKMAMTMPSATAKPSVYEQLDPSERIFDDRPNPDYDIPPAALLYEGFGHFLDIMDGRDDIPGMADINVRRLHSEVDMFANKMNEYYENKDARRDAILPCLRRIFSAHRGLQTPEIHAGAIGSTRTDDHNVATHGAGDLVVGFKNEITGIIGIPCVELAGHIARLPSTKIKKQLYLGWRIPCLGLTIVGCVLTFSAVVAIDHRFKFVCLTPTLSCIQSASDGRDRRSLYLAFIAASVLQAHILQDVEKFRNNPPQEIPHDARRFPAVSKLRKYGCPSDDYFNFEIKGIFPDRQPYRLLYEAVTPDDDAIVLIKFVPQYSIELHQFCGESGHAPKILAFDRLPGGWYAIAMEYIVSGRPITASPQLSIHRDRWANELRCLMNNFHLKGFVHGDLRDANIYKEESVMLIDFDWGGKDGEVFYPTANLNNELQEGRVSDDLRITKEDDRRVLEKTLAKLYIPRLVRN